MRKLIYKIRLWWWGRTTIRVTDTMEAWGSPLVTEYEVLDCRGKVIGFFAYGNFDPSLPYRGENP